MVIGLNGRGGGGRGEGGIEDVTEYAGGIEDDTEYAGGGSCGRGGEGCTERRWPWPPSPGCSGAGPRRSWWTPPGEGRGIESVSHSRRFKHGGSGIVIDKKYLSQKGD